MKLVYSNLYKHSQYQSKISPNNYYVANAVDDRLVIRRQDRHLQVLQVHETRSPIDYIQWAPNSEHILTVNYQKSRVYIRSLTDPKWQGSIVERRFPIVRVRWSPDSKSILCISELKLRLAIWNLSTQELKYMNHLKFIDKGIEFSPDGNYVAIVELIEGKEYISIYHANSFILLQRFEVDTADLENLIWSFDSMFIAVWDNCIYHKLLIYRQDGHLYKAYSGYQFGLGIKTVIWSPNNQLIAIGNYDETIHVLSALSFDLVDKLEHSASIAVHSNITPIEEIEAANPAKISLGHVDTDYHILVPPLKIPIRRPEYNEPNPKTGISSCQFSPDSQYLFSKSDSMPTALWLWKVNTLSCTHVIKFRKHIKQVLWHPQHNCLLTVICGDGNLHFFESTEDGMDIQPATVPTTRFSVKKIKWSSDGNALILMDQELFCLAVQE
ncbi:uncharacterized protein B0P05DRAFT_528559 [Gilbertella persicaria]|uniref:uncharacterized protein n=1 Tax=Gilbertella persicaria TaxID=101096 RepID=UPI00221F6972|nr:uncharacterized protein B0P05DRAFT_528559 [Gilbertella persicaria]KAI8091051.1 hypothetical protein B0P05DRAFT_528559 [Gilbertella persicaria]